MKMIICYIDRIIYLIQKKDRIIYHNYCYDLSGLKENDNIH